MKILTPTLILEQLQHFFPDLTPRQIQQFSQLADLYNFWNAQINVISRKDMADFYTHHVLHSLAITRVQAFLPGSEILDVGTGGGFPGIPLAILFPETQFTLVDSIGKKIKVVKAVADALGLHNVAAFHERAENIPGKFDFVVSRAVTQMPDFYKWVKGKFKSVDLHALPNGILYLKGGDLTAELAPFGKRVKIYPIKDFFDVDYFETKAVVWVHGK